MASGDMVGALQEALHDPPTGSQALEARRMSWSLIFDILSSTRTADILTTVKALSGDERDTLMKYLYRGMELVRTPGEAGSINGAVLLSWHEKLTQVSGTGCIVRVMTDRRVV
ncbi:arp2/3 complex subunit [Malassezia pachydermatis]